MDSGAAKRSAIGVIVAAVVVVIVYFLVPFVPYAPKGIVLPTGKSFPAIPADQVAVFQPGAGPVTYQSVGRINVQYHSVTETPQGYQTLAEFAKSLAAKAGANGIILTGIGHTVEKEVPASQASYILRGMAIKYAS